MGFPAPLALPHLKTVAAAADGPAVVSVGYNVRSSREF